MLVTGQAKGRNPYYAKFCADVKSAKMNEGALACQRPCNYGCDHRHAGVVLDRQGS